MSTVNENQSSPDQTEQTKKNQNSVPVHSPLALSGPRLPTRIGLLDNNQLDNHQLDNHQNWAPIEKNPPTPLKPKKLAQSKLLEPSALSSASPTNPPHPFVEKYLLWGELLAPKSEFPSRLIQRLADANHQNRRVKLVDSSQAERIYREDQKPEANDFSTDFIANDHSGLKALESAFPLAMADDEAGLEPHLAINCPDLTSINSSLVDPSLADASPTINLDQSPDHLTLESAVDPVPNPWPTPNALLEVTSTRLEPKKEAIHPAEPDPTDNFNAAKALVETEPTRATESMDTTELIVGWRERYVSQNQRLFGIACWLSIATVLMAALFYYQVAQNSGPRYFGVTDDGRFLETRPLTEPHVSSKDLLDWTSQALTKALSLNFVHWRQQLMEVKEDFSETGFDSFVKSLDKGGHIRKIVSERLNLACVLTAAPVITDSRLVDQRQTWKLELPTLISYQSSAGVVASQKLLAVVLAQRADTAKKIKGVEIKQIVLINNR
ncbi:MAG: DotI/IcmL/TraM family protein [Deltaproteobacteria bacterium]|jgi:intracellular multiplication protein IcmL|nr:DotI/IcmL/TraM family protein [Deltaproteobacteria bacterium]